jgi:hypothetical protein
VPGDSIFSVIFKKVCCLLIWRIRIIAKNEGKLSISQLRMVHYEKNCRSFVSIPDVLDKAKKTLHATIPLRRRSPDGLC